MKNTFEDHGLILEPRKKTDYIFSGVTKVFKGLPVNPSGDWRDYLVEKEGQVFDGKDTYSCASMATLNCAEVLMNYLQKTINYSDRFVSIGSGTKVGIGNSPTAVADFIRHKGCITESSLPQSVCRTVEEFYQPNPLTPPLLKEAEETFLNHYTFQYEQLDSTDLTTLREALKYSPLPVSVVAWYQDGEEYFRPEGARDNHLVCLVYIDEEGHPFVFDSDLGQEKLKKLHKDYFFGYGEVIYISNEPSPLSVPWYLKLLDLLTKLLRLDLEWLKAKNAPVSPSPALPSNTTAPTPTPPQNAPEPQKQASTRWGDVSKEEKEALIKRNKRSEMLWMCREIAERKKMPSSMMPLFLATLECEADFNNELIHENKKNGRVCSTDYYIAQINDYYHIGAGKTFPSVQYVHDNPDKVVEWMADMFLCGKAKLWICYRDGYFKSHLADYA